jgi:ATP-dependent RNA helicase SUPV3L1/SUV3
LEAFVAAECSLRLAPLKALRDALGDGALRGLARGLAYRLVEAGGVIDRRLVAAEAAALSQAERRALRRLGVRFAAFSLHLPALFGPQARTCQLAFAVVEAPHWRPVPGRPTPLPRPVPPPRILAAHGLMACGGVAAPVDMLDRLDALLRAQPRRQGAIVLTTDALEALGWDIDYAAQVMRGLGFRQAKAPRADTSTAWRPPGKASVEAAPASLRPNSPFAALAALNPPAAAQERRKRKPRRGAARS